MVTPSNLNSMLRLFLKHIAMRNGQMYDAHARIMKACTVLIQSVLILCPKRFNNEIHKDKQDFENQSRSFVRMKMTIVGLNPTSRPWLHSGSPLEYESRGLCLETFGSFSFSQILD